MNNLTKIICVSVMLSGSALAQNPGFDLEVGDIFTGKSGNKYKVDRVKQGTSLEAGDTMIIKGKHKLYKLDVINVVPFD